LRQYNARINAAATPLKPSLAYESNSILLALIELLGVAVKRPSISIITGKFEQIKKQSIQSCRVAALEAVSVHHNFKICTPLLNPEFKGYM
jgi:hypothetical protein